MSVEAVAAVFAMRGLTPHEKLVALRFAEKAYKDGSESYPSAATVAADTGMSVRGVRGVIAVLVEEKRVLVPGGLSVFGTRTYKLDLTACAPDAPVRDAHGAGGALVQDAQSAPDTEGGCASPRKAVHPAHPTHPEPIQEPSSSASPKAKRRTKLPDPFMLTAEMRAWAAEKHPTVNVRSETEQFADYHRGKGSVQADWIATWRTWVRNAEKFDRRRTNGKQAPIEKSENATEAVFARITAERELNP